MHVLPSEKVILVFIRRSLDFGKSPLNRFFAVVGEFYSAQKNTLNIFLENFWLSTRINTGNSLTLKNVNFTISHNYQGRAQNTSWFPELTHSGVGSFCISSTPADAGRAASMTSVRIYVQNMLVMAEMQNLGEAGYSLWVVCFKNTTIWFHYHLTTRTWDKKIAEEQSRWSIQQTTKCPNIYRLP